MIKDKKYPTVNKECEHTEWKYFNDKIKLKIKICKP